MSNVENAPIARTTKPDSPPWNPPTFFDSDLIDVDLQYPEEDYAMEFQYPHIRPPDFHQPSKPLSLSSFSPHVSSESVALFSSAFTNNTRQSMFPSLLNSPSLDPDVPNDSKTEQANDLRTFSFDYALRTPADFSISTTDAITPFGKKFELAEDWIVSGSYVSPVLHAQHAKRQSSRLLSSPLMPFIDRLQAQCSSSPSDVPLPQHAKHSSQSPPPLLSPYNLLGSCDSSKKKENLLHAQFHSHHHAEASPSTSASSPVSRRPSTRFHGLLSQAAGNHLTPQRPKLSLFPISPLTPLTPSPHTSVSPSLHSKGSIPLADPKARKRRLSMSESPATRVKRTRYDLREADSLGRDTSRAPGLKSKQNAPSTQLIFTTRALPTHIPIDPEFPLFYRRFPVSSYSRAGGSGSPCSPFGMPHPGGEYNPPRDAFDLYTPRFVKGKGVDKIGLCPICIEQPERGGKGKKVWLAMKFSAFNYHMQFQHGISASTGRPVSPPIDFRVVARPSPKKTERTEVKQGKCHKCRSWIAIETVKDVDVKVKELMWWKHAVACHMASVLAGEGDVFEEDQVYEVFREMAVVECADTT
ncbi:hypothetical protein FB451DRAFT_307355 [Mycena latifolia]|nr:hypothetical protein FB451DRAFT_307355 [Mycena latifolia]